MAVDGERALGGEIAYPAIPGYSLLAKIGAGGMGQVYRARSTASGASVAIKVLRTELDQTSAAERLRREARALAELQHPAFVGYIDHGTTIEGLPFLVMEWLEGVDLEHRLRQGPLALDEVLALAERLARALAVAHDHGIIHRDLKPANIFLVDASPTEARLLDFGVARELDANNTLTRPGGVIGTPGYMAPEQACGAPDTDARADLFSLGCVLYECLTGRPAFPGEHVMAILAKVLMNDPVPAGALLPGIPPGLDALLERLLAKEPGARPRSAHEVIAALADLDAGLRGPERAPTPSLTRAEQIFHSVIFCRQDGAPATVSAAAHAETVIDPERLGEHSFSDLVTLVDGTRLLVMSRGAAISDQAMSAARFALALREAKPSVAVAVVSGRGQIAGDTFIGELLDRGAALLVDVAPGTIRLDEVTADLLDAGFEVHEDPPGHFVLIRTTTALPDGRRLLGRPTEMVGRRRELAVLEAVAEECFDEPCARAVLLVGEPGIGKSRLRSAFERRLLHGRDHALLPIIARCDTLTSGAPFALLRRILAEAAGLEDGAPPAESRRKLRALLLRSMSEAAVAPVDLYLGELIAPASTPPDELRVARSDSAMMRSRIERAWITWLIAESARAPVVLTLEDFHWSDRATARLLESTLDALADAPILLVVLARPSLRERFPSWLEDDAVTLVELGPLPPRAARKLLRQVLGELVSEEIAGPILDAAGGNPLFLEELIRMRARGESGSLPATIVGMLEARIARLSADERQVLRAASVFGEVFWRGGVRALVGEGKPDPIERLVDEEWFVGLTRSQIADEDEFAFRHALVRDAAYATLVAEDRRLGHRLAAQWLEARGRREPLVLAEHYRQGGAGDDATRWFAVAADEAFERNAFDVVIDLVERALPNAAPGEPLARLMLRRAEVLAARGAHREAAEAASRALELFATDHPLWCSAAGEVALASARVGDTRRVGEIVDQLAAIELTPGSSGGDLMGLFRAAIPLTDAGAIEAAAAILDKLLRVASLRGATDPGALGAMHAAKSLLAAGKGAYDVACREGEEASRVFERAGRIRDSIECLAAAGWFLLELGAIDRGEAALRRLVERAQALGLEHVCAVAHHNLGHRIATRGRIDEALALEEGALECFERHQNERMCGLTLAHIAWIHALKGDLDRALEGAERALLALRAHPGSGLTALAIRAKIRLQRGDLSGAVADAEIGVRRLEALDAFVDAESLVRLTLAECLCARGDDEAAAAAIQAAAAALAARAERITDEALRRSFCAEIPENRRILELHAARTRTDPPA